MQVTLKLPTRIPMLTKSSETDNVLFYKEIHVDSFLICGKQRKRIL